MVRYQPPSYPFYFIIIIYWGEPQASPTVMCWLGFLSRYIYIYIGIDGPTSSSVFDPPPGVKVGYCGQNLRVVTLCANDLLYFTSSSNSSLIELRRSLAFDCQHWTTVQKNIRTSELNAIKSRNRDFFCLRASQHRNMVFYFPIFLRIEKAYSTKQRYHCNSLTCKLLPQIIDNSATKRFFFYYFDRQLSYSCLSHSSSVLAANDCRVVLTFLQRSPSFSLASASRVQHDNESWHARQRAYLTNTSNLSSYDSRTRTTVEVVRGLMCSCKKTYHNVARQSPFDFFDLSSSNPVQESSVDLWDNLHKVRGLPHNALHFPSYYYFTLLYYFVFSPLVGSVGVDWMSGRFPTQNK